MKSIGCLCIIFFLGSVWALPAFNINQDKVAGGLGQVVLMIQNCAAEQNCGMVWDAIQLIWKTGFLAFQLEPTDTKNECFDKAEEFCVQFDGTPMETNICHPEMKPTWIFTDGRCIAYVDTSSGVSIALQALNVISNSQEVQFVEMVTEMFSVDRLHRPLELQLGVNGAGRPFEHSVGHMQRPVEMSIGHVSRPVESQVNGLERKVGERKVEIGRRDLERKVGEIGRRDLERKVGEIGRRDLERKVGERKVGERKVGESIPWYNREKFVASREAPVSHRPVEKSVSGDDSVCTPAEHWTWGLSAVDGAADNNDAYNASPSDGTGVFVYVLDTGFYAQWNEVEEFAGRVDKGKSFISGQSVNDLNSHGTHCAGTIGSKSYGVAKNVKIIPGKVLSDQGSGSSYGVNSGMEWVIEDANARGAPLSKVVVSMSLGGGFSQSQNNVVDSLVAAGVTVVVAAGNDNSNACSYSPASAAGAITVGSTMSSNSKSSFSNHGSCVDVLAPGSSIQSTTSGMKVEFFSGTSMACPHVAGVVASMLSRCEAVTPEDVMAQFQNTDGAWSVENIISGFNDATPNIFVQNQCGESMCFEENLSYWTVDPISSDDDVPVPPPAGDGCVGFCGGSNPNDGCYCDNLCTEYGDCCSNYNEECGNDGGEPEPSSDDGGEPEPTSPPPSEGGCAGFCGGSNPNEGCYCDDLCAEYGDCCSNFNEECNGSEPTPSSDYEPPSSGGCAGFCGGSNPNEGCYCDDLCTSYGDCCSNFNEECGGDGSDDGPSCKNLCGGGNCSMGCYCDSMCSSYNDCCPDYFEECTDGGSPPTPGAGCENACGGSSPDGCYCDVGCEQFADCCSNYDTECKNPAPEPTTTSLAGPTPTEDGGVKQTCEGFCKGANYEANCYCDDTCLDWGDCCPDYLAACNTDSSPEPTEFPEDTCAGLKGVWCKLEEGCTWNKSSKKCLQQGGSEAMVGMAMDIESPAAETPRWVIPTVLAFVLFNSAVIYYMCVDSKSNVDARTALLSGLKTEDTE